MKTQIISALVFLLSLQSLTGCKKESNSDEPPGAESFNKLMDEGYKSLVQTATFDASNSAFVFTSNKGTTVTIDGTCLRKNGGAVSGTVTLEFFEAYDRADMLVANKPTMGRNATGEIELLESAGQYFIAVKQNGSELTSNCGIQISTPESNAKGDITGMNAWDAAESAGKLVWESATKWEVVRNPPKGVLDATVPGMGGFNFDRLKADPRPKTEITALVPSGYANVSTVSIFVKGCPNALGGIYGWWPIGLECYLIFVTEKNGQYRWIIKETTITSNHAISFDLKDAQTGSRAEYVDQVKLLK